VGDCLNDAFFARLDCYRLILSQLNIFSLMAQSKAVPTLSATPFMVWKGFEILKVVQNDGAVTTSLKRCLLEAWTERMSIFVDIELDSDGDVLTFPNGMKAALLDPRFSRQAQEKLGLVVVAKACEIITTDALHLVGESLTELVGTQMQSGLVFVMQALYQHNAGPETNSLKWWSDLMKTPQGTFLSGVFSAARLFLSMPAGSSPSECVFSTTTDIVTKKRSSLGDGTLEKLTVIRAFLHSQFYSFENIIKRLVEDAKKKRRE
jgi:hypothetical protein